MTAQRLASLGAQSAAVGALCLGTAFALTTLGPGVALVPLALLLALVLLSRPGLALGLFLAVTVLLESDAEGFLPVTAVFWDPLPKLGVSVPDLLFLLLVGSVLLDFSRRKRPVRLPEPFMFPLVIVAAALCVGVVTGYLDGGSREDIVTTVRLFTYLLVLPFLVVNTIQDRRSVRWVIVGGALLAVYKGFEGTIAWLAGAGRTLGDTNITFYQPAANWVLLLFMLALAAAALLRVQIPRFLWLASPVVLAAFTLSFRRSFWIAAILGLVLVVMLAGDFRGRRRLVPSAAALGLAIWALSILGGGATELESSAIAERARLLKPTSIQSYGGDRYRIAEQRNVLEELRRNPVTGLGVGVPWTIRSPIALKPGGRNYVHVAVLWYWLKLGIAGLIAYVVLLGSAIFASFRLAKSEADRLIRVIGLALVGGFVGLVVVETTAAFVGANLRLTILVAAVLGWLAAVRLVEPGAAVPSRGGRQDTRSVTLS